MLSVLGALVAFAPLSIDMYLAALPDIAREFADTAGAAQYTLAAYFIGMALGQSFYGPVADRYGRKPPLYCGLVLYALASVGCALAPTIQSLLVCRFLQALGGCAGMVIPLAIVRDLYGPQATARVMSRLMLVMGVAPILAPLVGAQLLGDWGWRAIFWALAGCAAFALAAVRFGLAETLPTRPAQSISLRFVLDAYAGLLADRRYLGFALAGSFATAGMFAYIAGSSAVLIGLQGLSPQAYGWVFGANAFGLIAASQINHRLLRTRNPDGVLTGALTAMAMLGLVLALAAYCRPPQPISLVALLLPLFGFIAVLGFINPNTAAGAMADHGTRAGSAAALMGTLRFALATLVGAVVGLFDNGSAQAMGAVMAVCGVAALLAYRLLVVRGRVSATLPA